MARHIDVDRVIEQVVSLEQVARKRVCDTPTNSPAYERYKTQLLEREKMLAILKAQPAADVVPKSEVARLQSQINRLKKYDEERDIALHARLVANAKDDVAREIFEEIEKTVEDAEFEWGTICGVKLCIAELKKKYTDQSCNDCARNKDCEKAEHFENYRFKGCMDFENEHTGGK